MVKNIDLKARLRIGDTLVEVPAVVATTVGSDVTNQPLDVELSIIAIGEKVEPPGVLDSFIDTKCSTSIKLSLDRMSGNWTTKLN